MTQKDLVLALSQYQNDFKALNTVTLSRWETGVTSPSLRKKKTILHFLAEKDAFEETVCYDILKTRYETFMNRSLRSLPVTISTS